ncbi:MAG: DHA2 family efflux MFS transporter permease subunit [Alphaproteobacteria bacterium]|nr:DHA2 family efflux MFS transporter permease subunit [Alphaproteobacteria bacterium]
MTADSAAATTLTPFRRVLILAMLTLASTLYGTTILLVSVLLPQMQGSLSCTQDEIAWVMTFNILATAVATPMTGWLVARFGRRRVINMSTLGFTVATFLCGTADSLETLVLYRIMQGGFGAPVTPLAQTVILDIFPRHQHAAVTAVFGMAVVIGPVIGPILGGYLSELYNWRATFYMLVPVGIAGFVGLVATLPPDGARGTARLDWVGFLSFSAMLVCLQLMLSRGERLDWFTAPEIMIEAAGAAVALYVFLAHSLTTPAPFLNLRLLLDRNYAIGLLLVGVYGMVNFTPMVILPSLLQTHAGYPDSVIGELLAARGIGGCFGFFFAMYAAKLDSRVGMIVGFGLNVISGLWLASLDLNLTFYDIWINSFIQGIAIGLVWVPLVVASFATVDPRHSAETNAVFHLLRNIGSSVFITLSVSLILRTQSANYSRMTEYISPFAESFAYPSLMGAWNLESVTSLMSMGREINRQAAMLGYLNAFLAYTLVSLLAIPLILLVRGGGRRRQAVGKT